MKMTAYFDNSATTMPCEEAVAAAENAMKNSWGNPSSLHAKGTDAEKIVEDARDAVAAAMHCSSKEIYFTSGGTEADNIAVFGAAERMKRYGKRIVSTEAEHPAVYEALTKLETEGFEVVRLKPDSSGKISESDVYDAVTRDTVLVSIMAVNNEVGSIMPVRAAKRAAAKAGSPALIHCDAVQAFGKTDIRPSLLGADLITISAHKIHGIKGAGALYIGKDVKIAPHVFGGEQEKKIRPGTQAVPAIAAFGAAVKALPDVREEEEKMKALRARMLSRFEEIGDIVVNSPDDALPYVTNVSVLGIKSEPMLNFLSSKGIYVSSGSACARGRQSRMLKAMGLDSKRLESPVRISFSRYTSESEIDYLCDMIELAKKEIRATAR